MSYSRVVKLDHRLIQSHKPANGRFGCIKYTGICVGESVSPTKLSQVGTFPAGIQILKLMQSIAALAFFAQINAKRRC